MSEATLLMPDDPAIRAAAENVVTRAGLGAILQMTRLHGGGNNRGFQIKTQAGEFFLKAYFQDRADLRNRLDAEFRFSKFAWDHGVRTIPQPIAEDRDAGLGLYAYVHGQHLSPADVSSDHVTQAIEFWRRLNQSRATPAASALPLGSEACFSFDEHLACVDRRLARLAGIEQTATIDRDAARFLADELVPSWNRVAASARRRCAELGFVSEATLVQTERCLSPSDFGFHNAMADAHGRLVFFDFEYAGWDDPAKVVCDFFCQPRLPSPPDFFTPFASALIHELGLDDRHIGRIRLLWPVYRVKWCCILLNEFLPMDARRRQFAAPTVNAESRTLRQLGRARQSLSQLTAEETV